MQANELKLRREADCREEIWYNIAIGKKNDVLLSGFFKPKVSQFWDNFSCSPLYAFKRIYILLTIWLTDDHRMSYVEKCSIVDVYIKVQYLRYVYKSAVSLVCV